MKKFLLILILAILLSGCDENNSKSQKDRSKEETIICLHYFEEISFSEDYKYYSIETFTAKNDKITSNKSGYIYEMENEKQAINKMNDLKKDRLFPELIEKYDNVVYDWNASMNMEIGNSKSDKIESLEYNDEYVCETN